jgi:hypothetical protein
MQKHYNNRMATGEVLLQNPRFVGRKGQPLHFMKKLELDDSLLEQPLYH